MLLTYFSNYFIGNKHFRNTIIIRTIKQFTYTVADFHSFPFEYEFSVFNKNKSDFFSM